MFRARRFARTFLVLLAAASGTAISAAKMSTGHQVGVDPHGRPNVSIPIEVPPGSGGMVPSIALTYNGDGSGIAGVGWSLGAAPLATRTRFSESGVKTESGTESAASAITRCPSTVINDGLMGGIKLDYTDRFCLDGQRLVVHGTGTYGHDLTEYRTEVESFTKVVSYGTTGSGPSWFKVWTKAGLILEYGNTTDSRIMVSGSTTARLWALNKLSDRSSNYYETKYTQSAQGEYLIDRIDYTGNANSQMAPYNSVRFSYEDRPDISTQYVVNLSYQQRKRLTSIKTYNETTLVKDYRISYSQSASSGRSMLGAVSECDGAGICLPGLSFGYYAAGMGIDQAGSQTTLANMVAPQSIVSLQAGDFNGDGHQDVWVVDSGNSARVCYGPTFTAGCTAPFAGSPEAVVLDWDGDGLSDLAFYNPVVGNLLFCRGPNPTPYVDCYSAPNAANPLAGFVSYKWIAGDFDADGRDELFGWSLSDPLQTFGMHCNPMVIIAIPGTSQAGTTCNGSAISGIGQTVVKGDFDGDGLTDLLFMGTAGYRVCTGRSMTSEYPCTTVAGPNWRDDSQVVVGDYNGDGNADLIRLTLTGVESCPGPGFISANNCVAVPTHWTGDWRMTYRALSGDFNGDGASDLVLVHSAGAWVRYGPGIQTAANAWSAITNQNWSLSPIAIADFKGDGSSDFLVGQGASSILASGAVNATDRLYSATNLAFNVGHSFLYRPLTDGTIYTKGTMAAPPPGLPPVMASILAYPLQDTRQPLWVATQHNRPNGVAATNAVNFKYEKGRINLAGRRFLGYEIVKDTDVASGRETVTTRSQTYPHYYRASDRKVYVGGNLVAKSYSDLGQMNNFESKPISVTMYSIDASYGLDGSWKSDKISYGYDAYGNVVGMSYYVDEFSMSIGAQSGPPFSVQF